MEAVPAESPVLGALEVLGHRVEFLRRHDRAELWKEIGVLARLVWAPADTFPGTGRNGNGIPNEFKTRDQWIDVIKTNGCGNCHQIGNFATRTIPAAFAHSESELAAWARRLQSGPGGTTMTRTMGRLLTPDGGHLAALADWTARITAGELPKTAPSRPTGIERNLGVTVRDWLDPKHYLYDLTASANVIRP